MIARFLVLLKSPALMGAITVASTALAIYQGFFYEKRPEIRVTIISNADVFSVTERLTKLDVTYAGESLSKSAQKLRLVNLRIANVGSADLTKSSFDENALLGVQISSGDILETPEVTGAEYFRKNVRPRLENSRTVLFSPIIVSSGDAFDVRLLVLLPQQDTFNITPIGKIAGVRPIEIVDLASPQVTDPAPSLIGQALDGPWYVHPIRAMVYVLLTMLVFVAVPTVRDYRERGRQSSRILRAGEWFRSNNLEIGDRERLLIDIYGKAGRAGLTDFLRILNRLKHSGKEDSRFHAEIDADLRRLQGRFTYAQAPKVAARGFFRTESQVAVSDEGISLVERVISEFRED